jgi:thioredoxin-like negative regulator of GroEL
MTVSKPTKRPDNAPNREELLQMAIQAAKAGQKEGARVMFRQILEQDRRNERAMMWMAKLASTKAEQVQWLEKVLAANPDNAAARQTLNRIQYKKAAGENRMLVIGGVIAFVLVVLVIAVILVLTTRPAL